MTLRLAAALLIAAALCARAELPPQLAALGARALVASGDTARLQQVMARARRGDTVTVAVIGGSITAGAKASRPENRYGDRVAAWWRAAFPTAHVGFVNAGIGATGSNFGALRARRDLLDRRPDVVVVEYAVNDGNTREAAETLEGLVRQILAEPQQPAALLLFTMHQGGGNAQEWHSRVGAHYGLPMVSFRDALWPEIAAGRLAWAQVEADDVHPNDLGHELAARYITDLLSGVAAAPAAGSAPAIAPLPAPLYSDTFARTALLEAPELKPVSNQGWTLDAAAKAWKADQPGSVIEFELSGTALFTMHFVMKKPFGRAAVRVDGGAPMTLEAWFDQTWGGYRQTKLLARDLAPGPHRVRLELLSEKSAGSEGHEFRLLGLGAAGVPCSTVSSGQ